MGIGYIVFGNVDSRNYNITVAFKDVDHTPKRVYQHIAIPGRNGEFYLDEKRFEDVPVSYDCIALDDDDRKSFVNALAAQTGHVRLEDTFNVGEFYSAVFEGDVDPYVTQDRENSTFTIHFTRKPQRWLTSGETATTVANNGTLTNPTLFEASPLLEVKGYGTIGFNGYEIELTNDVVGHISLANAVISGGYYSVSYDTNSLSLIDLGDMVTVHDGRSTGFMAVVSTGSYTPTSATLTQTTSNISGTCSHTITMDGRNFIIRVSYTGDDTFAYDGSNSSVVDRFTLTISYTDSSNNSGTLTRQVEIAEQHYKKSFGLTTYSGTTGGIQVLSYGGFTSGEITAESTQTLLGNPTYIDCDYGEAYKIKSDEYVSLNQYIDLGSDLPKLASGVNEITYDNTITSLDIKPNWWKV